MKAINVKVNKKETSPNLLKVKKKINILPFDLLILTERASYMKNKKKIIFIAHGFKKSRMIPFMNKEENQEWYHLNYEITS